MPDLSNVTAILPDLADYLVYSAIAVVTLIGLFKCLIPLWKTTGALRRAISRLQANAGKTTDKPVWQEARFVGKKAAGHMAALSAECGAAGPARTSDKCGGLYQR